ncbi:hypothetical protein JCM19029_12880 [Salinicoccus sesuvii]
MSIHEELEIIFTSSTQFPSCANCESEDACVLLWRSSCDGGAMRSA